MKQGAPMKRTGALKRKTGLSAASQLKRSGQMQRGTGLKRNTARPAGSPGATLKRSAFAPKLPVPARTPTQLEYTPRPREVAQPSPVALVCAPRPAPKLTYVRDERLRFMCGAMACQHCGREGLDAGVTWAHSNQSIHGKGRSIKASDIYVAALCAVCHVAIDQGSSMSYEDRIALWEPAHRRTVLVALRDGLWPPGVPLPIQIGEREIDSLRSIGQPSGVQGVARAPRDSLWAGSPKLGSDGASAATTTS